MGKEAVKSPITPLFEAPLAKLWLPAFAAAAIGDPVAAEALGPYIGPSNMPIEGGGRARVPGDVHFALTWGLSSLASAGRVRGPTTITWLIRAPSTGVLASRPS